MKVSTAARIASMSHQIEQLNHKLLDAQSYGDRLGAECQMMHFAVQDILRMAIDARHHMIIDECNKFRSGVRSTFMQQHYIFVAAIIKAERAKLREKYKDDCNGSCRSSRISSPTTPNSINCCS